MRNRLSSYCLALLWLSSAIFISPAQTEPVFRVAIYYPQVPPYMYAAEDNSPQGVIPDLLNAFFARQPYMLQYVYENRYRAEIGLYEGKYDASVLSATWTMQPEELLFSQPVLEHRDYLYAVSPFNDEPASLAGKTICLRRHYIYSALNAALQREELIRIDAESEFDQFNMLVNNRCQLVYMNEHVAAWLINRHFTKHTLYRQSKPVDQTDLTLALHPKWAVLKPRLDAFIREAHRTGVIDRALARHLRQR